jgi:cyclophilin family peptidyl-prolyl cis-trans isomerase
MQRLLLLLLLHSTLIHAQQEVKLRKKDRRRDVELVTTAGAIRLHLYDATPQHRDNFLRLVKTGFYDSTTFHRVIAGFMVQGGELSSKRLLPAQQVGNSSLANTIAAEIRPELFHHRGALAAARTSDNVNPERRSSTSQFYIVQGKTWTDAQMDSLEEVRVKQKIVAAHRAVYNSTGGTPQLDNQYTIFGYVVKGLETVDKIAATPVNPQLGHRPLQDVRIVKARLVRRK